MSLLFAKILLLHFFSTLAIAFPTSSAVNGSVLLRSNVPSWYGPVCHVIIYLEQRCRDAGKKRDSKVDTFARFVILWTKDNKDTNMMDLTGDIGYPDLKNVYDVDVGEIKGELGFYFRWKYYQGKAWVGNDANHHWDKMTFHAPKDDMERQDDDETCAPKIWSEADGSGTTAGWWSRCADDKNYEGRSRWRENRCGFICEPTR